MFCFGRGLNAHTVQNLWRKADRRSVSRRNRKQWDSSLFMGPGVGGEVILHCEVNLEQSSASSLQQRWKEKVISDSNRQRVRLPTPPTKEENILNLSYYHPNIMGWTCAILFYESWLMQKCPMTSSSSIFLGALIPQSSFLCISSYDVNNLKAFTK